MKRGNARTNIRNLYRNTTDYSLSSTIQTTTMYSEIRIIFFKIHNSNISLSDIIGEDIILEMNNILKNHLKGKKYSFDIAKDNAASIPQNLNNYLKEKEFEVRPCSTEICYILEEPIEFKFNYKIIRLEYCKS